MEFKVGQQIEIISNSFHDELPQYNIKGWSGEIIEIEFDGMLMVMWDAPTMELFDMDYIKAYEIMGLDFQEYALYPNELELVRIEPKVSAEITKQKYQELRENFKKERGVLFQEIIQQHQKERDKNIFAAWCRFLRNKIEVPTMVYYYPNSFSHSHQFPIGTPLMMIEIELSYDKKRGVLAKGKFKNKEVRFLMKDVVFEEGDEAEEEALDIYQEWIDSLEN